MCAWILPSMRKFPNILKNSSASGAVSSPDSDSLFSSPSYTSFSFLPPSPVSESDDLSPQTPIKESGFARIIKPLRIAIIAPLHQSVPPKPGKYSDKSKELISPKHELDKEADRTAQIVNELVEGLVARGHQVTLFASPDSNTSAQLVTEATYGAFRGKRVMPGMFNHAYRWMFEQVRRRADKFDVLHFHTFEHLPHIDDFMGQNGDHTV
uniref:Glyco_trans_4-like_N domain-containing protein n=1 Tax=Globodera pallida TaxID=36090 RepID=A0A183C6C4_GLOPA